MILRFRALHLTANGNLLLEPVNHKEPVSRKTQLMLKGKKAAAIFDTIANVESPLYLAKPTALNQDINGQILQTGGKQ